MRSAETISSEQQQQQQASLLRPAHARTRTRTPVYRRANIRTYAEVGQPHLESANCDSVRSWRLRDRRGAPHGSSSLA